ncbi:MAG: GPW/gp25 family protein [Actinobacteria bacterium]|nr:MAG: GPW/gp25 family protein [Actinomycetota bacterium]
MTSLAHLGRGWTFPVAVDPLVHGLPYVDGPDKVRQSIRIILDTDPGERVMRPTFGCGLRRYLAQPNTVSTRAQIKRDVEQGLAAWEPRIKTTRIDVIAGDDPSLVEIAISYVHLRTGRPDNLVYPFSLE